MDSTRWNQIQTLFHEAAELPASQRRAFLEDRCGKDSTLAEEVMELLNEDTGRSSILDGNVGEVADRILNDVDPSAKLPFKEFGPYRILKILGEGGMGSVYLVERADLGSLGAMKILRDAWLSPARRERFTIEQRTLAQLVHPYIARLYDADTSADGTPFFVMEYVEGVALTDYCEAHLCTVEQRLQLFREVCEAVLYAHQHAVIHRDLKPSNIFVKEDGTVRLLDFGIAKHLENLGDSVAQTLTGLRLMTPAYAAPEQFRGDQVGLQSDVYSLGVILYQLIAGQLPFDISDCTPAQAARVLTEYIPAKPSAIAQKKAGSDKGSRGLGARSKSTWSDLDVLCQTAMHKDIQRRYQSVDALIRDIDHYLTGEPLDARPDSMRYRLQKFVSRNQVAVYAASAVFALIVGLVAFFTIRLAIARNSAMEEAARTERIQKFMTNLFQGGDAAAGPAEQLRVVSLLDRGVQEADSLNSEPEVQADLYATLGGIYQKLGKYDRADPLLQAALNKRKLLHGTDSTEAAESMTALGLLRSDQARLNEAEILAEQGLEIDRRRLLESNPAVSKALLAYGQILAQRGSYDKAIQVLSEAVQNELAPGVAPADLASALSTLAEAHYSAGHYDQATVLYRRVLEMHRSLYGERHPRVADDLENLSSIQQDLGYYSEAEKLDREALDIVRSYYGKEHPKTAKILTMLGRSLHYQKKYDEGQAALEEALAIQERIFGPVHPDVADTVNEMGNVASERGNYQEAETRFQRVADIYHSVYGDHHYLVAIALSNEAYAYLNMNNYSRAEEMFRDVVRRFTETLSADNVNSGIARIKLGRALLRQKRFQEAEVETHAGYDVLLKQTSSSISFLQAARNDLAAEYDALEHPELAAKYRAEHEAAAGKPTVVAEKH